MPKQNKDYNDINNLVNIELLNPYKLDDLKSYDYIETGYDNDLLFGKYRFSLKRGEIAQVIGKFINSWRIIQLSIASQLNQLTKPDSDEERIKIELAGYWLRVSLADKSLASDAKFHELLKAAAKFSRMTTAQDDYFIAIRKSIESVVKQTHKVANEYNLPADKAFLLLKTNESVDKAGLGLLQFAVEAKELLGGMPGDTLSNGKQVSPDEFIEKLRELQEKRADKVANLRADLAELYYQEAQALENGDLVKAKELKNDAMALEQDLSDAFAKNSKSPALFKPTHPNTSDHLRLTAALYETYKNSLDYIDIYSLKHVVKDIKSIVPKEFLKPEYILKDIADLNNAIGNNSTADTMRVYLLNKLLHPFGINTSFYQGLPFDEVLKLENDLQAYLLVHCPKLLPWVNQKSETITYYNPIKTREKNEPSITKNDIHTLSTTANMLYDRPALVYAICKLGVNTESPIGKYVKSTLEVFGDYPGQPVTKDIEYKYQTFSQVNAGSTIKYTSFMDYLVMLVGNSKDILKNSEFNNAIKSYSSVEQSLQEYNKYANISFPSVNLNKNLTKPISDKQQDKSVVEMGDKALPAPNTFVMQNARMIVSQRKRNDFLPGLQPTLNLTNYIEASSELNFLNSKRHAQIRTDSLLNTVAASSLIKAQGIIASHELGNTIAPNRTTSNSSANLIANITPRALSAPILKSLITQTPTGRGSLLDPPQSLIHELAGNALKASPIKAGMSSLTGLANIASLGDITKSVLKALPMSNPQKIADKPNFLAHDLNMRIPPDALLNVSRLGSGISMDAFAQQALMKQLSQMNRLSELSNNISKLHHDTSMQIIRNLRAPVGGDKSINRYEIQAESAQKSILSMYNQNFNPGFTQSSINTERAKMQLDRRRTIQSAKDYISNLDSDIHKNRSRTVKNLQYNMSNLLVQRFPEGLGMSAVAPQMMQQDALATQTTLESIQLEKQKAERERHKTLQGLQDRTYSISQEVQKNRSKASVNLNQAVKSLIQPSPISNFAHALSNDEMSADDNSKALGHHWQSSSNLPASTNKQQLSPTLLNLPKNGIKAEGGYQQAFLSPTFQDATISSFKDTTHSAKPSEAINMNFAKINLYDNKSFLSKISEDKSQFRIINQINQMLQRNPDKNGQSGSVGLQSLRIASEKTNNFQHFLDSVNPSALSTEIKEKGGSGHPIPSDIKSKMEGFFGADFSNVRLHTDIASAEASRNLSAQAFTVGKDIYFAPGKYSPTSKEGVALLGHELTHVMQQSGIEPRMNRMDAQHAPATTPLSEEREAQLAEVTLLNAALTPKFGGLQVERFERDYYNISQDPIGPRDASRLDQIGALALRIVQENIGAVDDVIQDLQVDITLDLVSQTDQQAAQIWADAIIDAIGTRRMMFRGDMKPAVPAIELPSIQRAEQQTQAQQQTPKPQDAITPAVEAEMVADVNAIKEILRKWRISDYWEKKILSYFHKWLERGDIFFDRFRFRLLVSMITMRSFRNMYIEETRIVSDAIADEMEDENQTEYRRLMALPGKWRRTKREVERVESAWAAIGKQELMGIMGMVKGLSGVVAGLIDAGLWLAWKGSKLTLGQFLEKAGYKMSDLPPALLPHVNKGWDEIADIVGKEVGVDPKKDPILFGQSAFEIGEMGGKVVGNLATLGAGAGGHAVKGIQVGVKVLGYAAALQGIEQSVTGIYDRILVIRKKNPKAGIMDYATDGEILTLGMNILGSIGSLAGGAKELGLVGKGVAKFFEKFNKAVDAANLISLFKRTYDHAFDSEFNKDPAKRDELLRQDVVDIINQIVQLLDPASKDSKALKHQAEQAARVQADAEAKAKAQADAQAKAKAEAQAKAADAAQPQKQQQAEATKLLPEAATQQPVAPKPTEPAQVAKPPEQQKLIAGPEPQKLLPAPEQQKLLTGPEQQKLLPAPEQPKRIEAPAEQKLLTGPEPQKLLPAPEDPKLLDAPQKPRLLPEPEAKKVVTQDDQPKKLTGSEEPLPRKGQEHQETTVTPKQKAIADRIASIDSEIAKIRQENPDIYKPSKAGAIEKQIEGKTAQKSKLSRTATALEAKIASLRQRNDADSKTKLNEAEQRLRQTNDELAKLTTDISDGQKALLAEKAKQKALDEKRRQLGELAIERLFKEFELERAHKSSEDLPEHALLSKSERKDRKKRNRLIQQMKQGKVKQLDAIIKGGKGSEEAIKKLLARHGRWEELMASMDAGTPKMQEAAKRIFEYRNQLSDALKNTLAVDVIGKPSTERVSDIDLSSRFISPNDPIMTKLQNPGDNPLAQKLSEAVRRHLGKINPDFTKKGIGAGEMVIAVERAMKDIYGPKWSEILRMNFYTEPGRLTKIDSVDMPPADRARINEQITQTAELLNFAKMMRHAGHDPVMQQKIKDMMKALNIPESKLGDLANFAKMKPKDVVQNRDRILREIDALEKRFADPNIDAQTKRKLAVEITEKQMLANLYSVEANISPASVKNPQTRTAVERYQSALTQVEMIMHMLHECNGSLARAGRKYEVHKYLARLTEDVLASRDSSPKIREMSDRVQQMSDIAYLLYKLERSRFSQKTKKVPVNPRQAQETGVPPVTNKFMNQMMQRYLQDLTILLPEMKKAAAAPPETQISKPQPVDPAQLQVAAKSTSETPATEPLPLPTLPQSKLPQAPAQEPAQLTEPKKPLLLTGPESEKPLYPRLSRRTEQKEKEEDEEE